MMDEIKGIEKDDIKYEHESGTEVVEVVEEVNEFSLRIKLISMEDDSPYSQAGDEVGDTFTISKKFFKAYYNEL